MPKTWKSIAAMSEDRAIGRGNDLPWHIPEEFGWFKKRTLGGILVMGRKTLDSLGGQPLPKRKTIVVTRSPSYQAPEGVEVVHALEPVLNLAFEEKDTRELFICGGEEIYRQTMPWVSEVLLTIVKRQVPDGDTHFPAFEDAFPPPEKLRDHPEFTVWRYLRENPLG